MGIPVMAFGEGVEITDDMIPDVAKQPEVMRAAEEAGRLLGERLRNGHDRAQVTAVMQKKMMAMIKYST